MICVTDDPSGLDAQIEPIELPNKCRYLIDKTKGNYAKLWIFSSEHEKLINEDKFMYLDLDVVVTGDLSNLFELNQPLAIGDGMKVRRGFSAIKHRLRRGYWPYRCPVNSSILVVQCGYANDLWYDFDPTKSPNETVDAKIRGTDQAWIYIRARDRLSILTRNEGIYRAAWLPKHQGNLPNNCRLVAFPGENDKKPWSMSMLKRHPWISRYYPLRLLQKKNDC
ncbi:hypothetical protein HH1059_03430 [Halorhodospira halochloris]|uniref:Hexosyltransferase n=2 Tax=Halorhodospira halochloris TaxID=1052 RepID=A0A2Z6EZA6_HALHR|nr:hypothetical protein HH1059_03430 [Halorhodospira halochloris]